MNDDDTYNDNEYPSPAVSTFERLKQIQIDAAEQELTFEQIAKLEEAFCYQASDNQACFLAGISTKKLERYEEINPAFAKRKEQLRSLVRYQAKKNITDKVMDGDVEMSKWLADRLLKDEGYSTRQEVTGQNGMPLIEIVSFKKELPPVTIPIEGQIESHEETK